MPNKINYEKKRPVREEQKPVGDVTPRQSRYLRWKQKDLKKQAEERRRQREQQ